LFTEAYNISDINSECLNVLQVSIYNTKIGKSVKLEEFQNLQSAAFQASLGAFKSKWAMVIKNHIRAGFKDAGKGWFNLQESSTEVYNFSKLKKFFILVNSRMQDALRFNIMRNVSEYVHFVRQLSAAQIIIKSSGEVQVYNAQLPPLFALDLLIVDNAVEEEEVQVETIIEHHEEDEEGTRQSTEAPRPKAIYYKKVIQYNSELETFVKVPGQLFLKGIQNLGSIPRVEKQVMDKLFWPDEPMIRSVSIHEEWVTEAHDEIESALKKAIEPLSAFRDEFSKYLEFLNFDIDTFMTQVEDTCRDATEEEEEDEDDERESSSKKPVSLDPLKIKSLIDFHQNARIELECEIPETICIGAFSVSASSLRKFLVKKHETISNSLVQLLGRRSSQVGMYVLEQFEEMETCINKAPETVEQLTELEHYMDSIQDKVYALQGDCSKLFKCIDTLESMKFMFSKQDDWDSRWVLFGCPKRIAGTIEKAQVRNERLRITFNEAQLEEQDAFVYTIEQLRQDVEGLSQFNNIDKLSIVAKRIVDFRTRINEAEEQARRFNSREVLFELELTNYDSISETNKEFESYETMWGSINDWLQNKEEWMSSKFTDLNSEEIEQDVYNYHRNLIRSCKLFEKKGLMEVTQVGQAIQLEVEAFKPVVPLIMALRNQGMRDRHWEMINTKLGYATDPLLDPNDPEFTLSKLLSDDVGILNNDVVSEMIVKQGEVAGKEYQIEQALDKMEHEWSDVMLDISPYKETGTYVLRGFDELQAILDEHVTMTQAMMFSAFKGPFEDRIEKWNRTLSVMSEVLEEWVGVQRNWLYLQPIFDSADILKQLPTEGKRFQTVDKNWRSALGSAFERPLAIKFCSDEKLLDRWIESNKFLDMVSKGLSDYLETKRGAFARFYFLSNEELLEILSQTKDPTMVQSHLKKCFEGIKRVHFDENQIITDMFSSEGEKIQLCQPINPANTNVEDWMTELDNKMKQSVKEVLYKSMLDYVQMKRTDWIQVVAGQCAINGSQFHWTREIEQALDEKGNEGAADCFEQQVQQINDMVALVRDPNLGKMARITLSALTVIDVHARDVTEQLKNEGVSNKEEFLWISQMRFYWVNGEGLDGNMQVSMVSSNRPYGYEYLGNSFRLVITPLTDKCYLTLMGALQMTLGGAPAGPAGTGKTETTKDLAKALAKQCVVFNCSDGLDYLAMGKFFKGLGSCGAWACFDEFNRIDVEVLSVVAQQIMTLQMAAKQGLTRIEFEGTMINMNDQFAVYITMNPGYAGRTELPDNLKALFRPVAMMVPDYALIGEIMLYSFGYGKARICAQKMVATFQLCSEQLSSQDHYDYGMRAVKTTIVAAGNLKAAEPDADEEVLLLRALQDVNLPKFLSHDLPLFKGIISDLFPGLKRPDIDYGPLLSCLKLTSEKMKLQPTPFFLEKCIQLYETIVVRHGLMLVGPTGGGKSSNIECLDRTLGLLKERGVSGFAYETVLRDTVNPKSITMGQLYGEFDQNTHEWQDGVLAYLVRDRAKSTTSDRKWVVFDGPVDAIWIENMNTVLDDNKKLCLNSGEIVALRIK